MERGLVMVGHSIIIGVILYVMMIILNVNSSRAENISILIGSITLQYMILFGHNLPWKTVKM